MEKKHCNMINFLDFELCLTLFLSKQKLKLTPHITAQQTVLFDIPIKYDWLIKSKNSLLLHKGSEISHSWLPILVLPFIKRDMTEIWESSFASHFHCEY